MRHEIKYDEHGDAYLGITVEVRSYVPEDVAEEMKKNPPDDFEVFELFSETERVNLGEQVLNQLGKILDVED